MVDLSSIGIVDLMVGLPPGPGDTTWRASMGTLLKDDDSRRIYSFPAQYMFKELPKARFASDIPAAVLNEMDRWAIERAMVGVTLDNPVALRAVKEHPDRFIASAPLDPNAGSKGVDQLIRAHEEIGARAATIFPAGLNPQVGLDDPAAFPFYSKCVELDIPVFVCAGVPGPRVPCAVQQVAHLENVCSAFPELRVVTRHGCEPWTDHMALLLGKWPNLFYSTSGFAPRYYPQGILEVANTWGAHKVMYAGYFPMGLSLERVMTELVDLSMKDHVWPMFLRENALAVLKLGP